MEVVAVHELLAPAGSPRLPGKRRWWMKGAHTKEHKPVAAAGERARWLNQGRAVPLIQRRLCSLVIPPVHFSSSLSPGLPSPLCPVLPRTAPPRQCAAAAGAPTSACLGSAAMQTTLGRGSCKLRVACPVRCGLIAAHICAMNLHVCRRLLSWKKKKKERRFFVVVASPDAAGHLRGGTRRSLVGKTHHSSFYSVVISPGFIVL